MDSAAQPLTDSEIDLLLILIEQNQKGALKNGSYAKRQYNRLLNKMNKAGQINHTTPLLNQVLQGRNILNASYNENANSPLFPGKKVAPQPQPGTSLYVYNKSRKSRKSKAAKSSRKTTRKSTTSRR